MTTSESFLFTDQEPPQGGPVFRGYAFVDTDYIYGQQGAQRYVQETGREIAGGHDGCYVTLREVDGAWVFETGHGGFRNLFYFHDGDTWAVSDSFVRITAYLRERFGSVKPHYAALASYGKANGFKQLTSFKTAADGVRLAPFDSRLVLRAERAQVERQDPLRGLRGLPYEEALGRHVGTWLGRYKTLLRDEDVHFRLDITGGRDSRANFGIFIAAQQQLRSSGQEVVGPRLHCGSVAGDLRDLEVATEVCSAFEVELNDDRKMPRALLDGRQRYTRWRESCLGTYHPMYLASTAMLPTLVEIGGGGAPNHRRTLESQIGSDDYEDFIQLARRRAANPLFAPEIEADLRQMFRYLSTYVADEDLLSEYYLHLRGRFHTGRPPKYRVSFHPFISRNLDAAREDADLARLRASQMNYDIMNMTAPDLLDIPFDNESKTPGAEVRGRLVSASHIVETDPGRTWWDSSELPNDAPVKTGGAIEHVAEEFEHARRDPFVREFFPKKTIDLARAVVETALEAGKLRHASDAIPVSQVLLAGEVSPSRRGPSVTYGKGEHVTAE